MNSEDLLFVKLKYVDISINDIKTLSKKYPKAALIKWAWRCIDYYKDLFIDVPSIMEYYYLVKQQQDAGTQNDRLLKNAYLYAFTHNINHSGCWINSIDLLLNNKLSSCIDYICDINGPFDASPEYYRKRIENFAIYKEWLYEELANYECIQNGQ